MLFKNILKPQNSNDLKRKNKLTTTPTAKSNYGAVYPKADNKLYCQDGAGTEYPIELGSSDYGEMGTSAQTLTFVVFNVTVH